MKQFYAGTPYIPKVIMLPEEIEDLEVMEEWLSMRKEQKVQISVPRKGQKERLVELANENAAIVLAKDTERIRREEGRTIGAVKEVEGWLGLSGVERMESYDISNISGFANVGSMVVYEKGKPKRSDYRKFRIKTVAGPDDYACMHEVLSRRFSHGLQERKDLAGQDMGSEFGSFSRFPDLILMDGGRGQVNVCLSVLQDLGLHIPVAGMVKDDNHRTRGLYYNNVEIPIDVHSEGFKLITRIQDETHRFAIEYHRSLRSKAFRASGKPERRSSCAPSARFRISWRRMWRHSRRYRKSQGARRRRCMTIFMRQRGQEYDSIKMTAGLQTRPAGRQEQDTGEAAMASVKLGEVIEKEKLRNQDQTAGRQPAGCAADGVF